MGNSHTKSFFGQNTGLILQSAFKTDPFIFLQCIKKKTNGNWEKPSKGEGKITRFSLEEIVMIIKVAKNELEKWGTYHKYNESTTQISINWQGDVLWINIGEYSKKLGVPEIEILKLLLDHILQEKIIYATESKLYRKENTTNKKNNFNQIYVKEEIITEKSPQSKKNKSKIEMSGKIKKQTDKALLIEFSNGIEAWIPKSKIHNQFSQEPDIFQTFTIDQWLLEKNNVIS